MAGTLRSEAMLTSRAAHFVCFLGQGHGDRVVTARGDEYGYGLSLLDLCRRLLLASKAMLQTICRDARGQLRAGKTFEEFLEFAR